MTTADAIKTALKIGDAAMGLTLADFSDADLLVRPVPGANHMAWQLGHLINTETRILAACGAAVPELPAGFGEKHASANSGSDNASDFLTKQDYLDRYAAVRAATVRFVESADAATFDAPGPEPIRRLAGTVGEALVLMGMHQGLHMGQVPAIRRKLGRPVVF